MIRRSSSGPRCGAAKPQHAPGDIEEFDRCIEIHGAMAHRLGQPIFDWGHTFSRGLRALIAGDTDRAEELAAEALQIGTDCGQPDAALIFGAQLMIVSGQRGTMSELIPLIEQMAADAPDISPWLFGSLLAKAHVEAGRIDDASRKLEEFAAAGFEMPLDQIWLTGMVDYAEAAIECGNPRVRAPPVRAARAVGRTVAGDRRLGARTRQPLPRRVGFGARSLRRRRHVLRAVRRDERTHRSEVLRGTD